MQESEIFFWIFTRNIFHAQAVTVNEKRLIIYLTHSLYLTSF